MSPVKMIIVGRLTVAAILAAGAGAVAYSGHDGWGWLLAGAVLFGLVTWSDK